MIFSEKTNVSVMLMRNKTCEYRPIVSVSIEICELFKLRTKTEYILNKTFHRSLLQN